MLAQQAVRLFDVKTLEPRLQMRPVNGPYCFPASPTSEYQIGKDKGHRFSETVAFVFRFRNELDVCREAMLPHLEYRR